MCVYVCTPIIQCVCTVIHIHTCFHPMKSSWIPSYYPRYKATPSVWCFWRNVLMTSMGQVTKAARPPEDALWCDFMVILLRFMVI